MTGLHARTLAGLDALHPDSVWDVLPGCDAPDGMPVCSVCYPSATIAADVLAIAGFAPARHAIPAPGLDGPYDITTVMRFSAGHGQDIVLVRRL